MVVHAGAGGVGSLAVQLGRPMGAGRVIATASSEEKRALALELGADAAVDAAPEGLADRLVEANGDRRVDVVFEMAGGEVFEQSLHGARAVRPGRRLRQRVGRAERRSQTGRLMRRSASVVGFWLMHCVGRPEMLAGPLADLFERAARGELRAIVGATYPLSRGGAGARGHAGAAHDGQAAARPGRADRA